MCGIIPFITFGIFFYKLCIIYSLYNSPLFVLLIRLIYIGLLSGIPQVPYFCSLFFVLFFFPISDLIISIALSSSILITSICSTLFLNPCGELFTYLFILLFSSRIYWFLFITSILLLIFSFSSYILFLNSFSFFVNVFFYLFAHI